MLSSPTSTTLIDDYIGVESCLHLKTNEELESYQHQLLLNYRPNQHATTEKKHRKTKKDFPPPLPRLTQTESSAPRTMKRYHTTDGRLIIREEKIKHREYLRSERCNGRLTLRRVIVEDHSDDVVLDNKKSDVKDEVKDDGMEDAVKVDGIEDGLDDDDKIDEAGKESMSGKLIGGFNGGEKCFEFNKTQMSSSPRSYILGFELPAIRPIRI